MILEKIGAATRVRVEKQKEILPLNMLREQAEKTEAKQGKSFYQALTGEEMAFICEVKKASPSKGIIVKEFPTWKLPGNMKRQEQQLFPALQSRNFSWGRMPISGKSAARFPYLYCGKILPLTNIRFMRQRFWAPGLYF